MNSKLDTLRSLTISLFLPVWFLTWTRRWAAVLNVCAQWGHLYDLNGEARCSSMDSFKDNEAWTYQKKLNKSLLETSRSQTEVNFLIKEALTTVSTSTHSSVTWISGTLLSASGLCSPLDNCATACSAAWEASVSRAIPELMMAWHIKRSSSTSASPSGCVIT